MRLLDQLAQARMPLQVVEEGRTLVFASARDHSAAVTACPIRFVADNAAADLCHELLRTDRGMLAAGNSLIRVPAPRFWLEWPCPPCPGAGARTGLLVEADERGRAGRIATFWEQEQGEPVPAQAVVEFDLDSDRAVRAAHNDGLALAPGLHPLASHLLFKIDSRWLSYLRPHGADAAMRSFRSIATNILPGIDFLFAFSAVLSERSVFERREVSHAPLNQQRAKRGKPALLDHVEVRFDLTAHARSTGTRQIGTRETARLHHVRGHMVHRNGTQFWRRSHLRGDPASPVSSRTVTVTSAARLQQRGDQT